MVGRLNTLLQDVEHLNKAIIAANGAGKPTMALEDARQIAVDEIATLVPVRLMPRDHGAIALYSRGGAILLEGSAAQLVFEPANVITPHHSLAGGTLSGITLDSGQQLWGVDRDLLAGGAIAAEFAIRDAGGPETQAMLDATARDLVDRFQSSSVDATIGAGMAGLFTDEGAAFAPADEVGLAGRLTLHTNVDPTAGGDPTLLRDGLYAAAAGPEGNATTLRELAHALSSGSDTMHRRATALVSHLGAARLASEREVTFAGAALGAAREMELSEGVDQDHEMQSLLLIEQTYAANARMIQTLDDLMQTLLRL
jgi:flagellar hook-associated protein 1 FlgK